MEKATRNFFMILGIAIIIIGLILWYFSAINSLFLIIFIIAGLALIVISLYNWGAGTDFSAKQKYPIENSGIEYNNDMKRS